MSRKPASRRPAAARRSRQACRVRRPGSRWRNWSSASPRWPLLLRGGPATAREADGSMVDAQHLAGSLHPRPVGGDQARLPRQRLRVGRRRLVHGRTGLGRRLDRVRGHQPQRHPRRRRAGDPPRSPRTTASSIVGNRPVEHYVSYTQPRARPPAGRRAADGHVRRLQARTRAVDVVLVATGRVRIERGRGPLPMMPRRPPQASSHRSSAARPRRRGAATATVVARRPMRARGRVGDARAATPCGRRPFPPVRHWSVAGGPRQRATYDKRSPTGGSAMRRRGQSSIGPHRGLHADRAHDRRSRSSASSRPSRCRSYREYVTRSRSSTRTSRLCRPARPDGAVLSWTTAPTATARSAASMPRSWPPPTPTPAQLRLHVPRPRRRTRTDHRHRPRGQGHDGFRPRRQPDVRQTSAVPAGWTAAHLLVRRARTASAREAICATAASR